MQRSKLPSFIGFRCTRAPAAGGGIPGDPNALYAETGIPRCRASQKQKSVFTNSDYIMPFMHCGPTIGPAREAETERMEIRRCTPSSGALWHLRGSQKVHATEHARGSTETYPDKRKKCSKTHPKITPLMYPRMHQPKTRRRTV